ncbi:MAG: hypothetical protein AB7S75_20235 [Desulfococcaceae bacterium]
MQKTALLNFCTPPDCFIALKQYDFLNEEAIVSQLKKMGVN